MTFCKINESKINILKLVMYKPSKCIILPASMLRIIMSAILYPGQYLIMHLPIPNFSKLSRHKWLQSIELYMINFFSPTLKVYISNYSKWLPLLAFIHENLRPSAKIIVCTAIACVSWYNTDLLFDISVSALQYMNTIN